MAANITGDIEVFQALRRKLSDLSGKDLKRAMTEMINQTAVYTAERIPRATSNLINSRFQGVTTTGDKTVGHLGYGAAYAVYVHEASGKLKGLGVPRHPKRLGNVWDPSGEPRFLEKGIEEMIAEDASEIIMRNMGL